MHDRTAVGQHLSERPLLLVEYLKFCRVRNVDYRDDPPCRLVLAVPRRLAQHVAKDSLTRLQQNESSPNLGLTLTALAAPTVCIHRLAQAALIGCWHKRLAPLGVPSCYRA